MKILIAEDDLVTQEILADKLTQWGYDVVVTNNGEEAWEAMQKEDAPKIALLDWEMPGMTGLEVAKRLRAEEQEHYTYIIILTARSQKDEIVAGFQVGADDYLTKPFEPAELQARLNCGQRILNLESEFSNSLSKLRENERIRKEFVAALTHDLRTPLIAEKRALEVIQTFETSEKSKGLITSLISNNESLLNMVNQLLEDFHTEEMAIKLSLETANLHDLVSDCFTTVRPLATPKNIHLTNNIAPKGEPLQVDTQQIKRVIMNLLGNAIANIPEASRIELSSYERGDFIEVQVRDNGPGINPERLPHLFERYYSGIGKLGSGLGLSICKTIIEMHGGKINVKSSQGEGTCFYFTLPKKSSQTPTHEGPYRVMITEDQELARVGLKFILEGLEEVEVIGLAEDGIQSLAMVADLNPDVVLMDMMMPNLDGVQATRKIKADFPEVKVIMLTSMSQAMEVQSALSAGADGYCLKDIKAHQLIEVIEIVMNGSRWFDPMVTRFAEEFLEESGTSPSRDSASYKRYPVSG